MSRLLALDDLAARGPASRPEEVAWQAIDRLGWLSPWWLRREVIERASRLQPAFAAYIDRPALPCEPGGCWVLLVNRQGLTLLREAFLLPLCWQPDAEDDPHLPGPLRELAGQIRSQVNGRSARSWGLRLPVPFREEPIDLSALEATVFAPSSAWASLVGGLLLAQDGLSPDPAVWASAAWEEAYGVGRVDGLEDKLALAAEWGAEHFFLPAQNQPDASAWQRSHGPRPEIHLLSPQRNAPAQRVLEPYLERLGVEPGTDASWEVCCRYYLRLDRKRADAFYWKRLLENDIHRSRENLPAECRPSCLITLLSPGPAIVAMAPAALRVECCLVLHAGALEGPLGAAYRQVETFLQGRNIRCRPAPLEGTTVPELQASARQAVAALVRQTRPEQLAFDLTPAFKNLSLALEGAAPPGAWLLYCRHDQHGPDRRAAPGSQTYDCWRKEG